MKDIIYFAKVKPNAKIPTKRNEDAGYDIYPCFEEDFIKIDTHTSKLIPTGIASAFDKKYGLVLRERGSTGVKSIKIGAGVIDSGFRNEIFVCIYNGGSYPIVIGKEDKIKNYPYISDLHEQGYVYPYEKAIAQAILIPIPDVDVKELPYDELKNISSDRGMGMLGSSGK